MVLAFRGLGHSCLYANTQFDRLVRRGAANLFWAVAEAVDSVLSGAHIDSAYVGGL